ncbi:RepB [Vibrio tubiashii]|nr:RepB [Vibrio tubiashii]
MTINELRHLYREQQLVEAIIEPSAQEGSWIVEFRHARGGFVLLTDSHGEECHYVNLDLASKSAMAVGFKHVRVESK